MKKLWLKSAEILFSSKWSSVHVKCTFDSCAEQYSLWVWKFCSQSSKLGENLKNVWKKVYQTCFLETQNANLSAVHKKDCQKSNFFCSLKDEKKSCISEESFLFWKWFAAQKSAVPPKVRHIFFLENLNW